MTTTPVPGDGLPYGFTGKVTGAVQVDRKTGRSFRSVAYFQRGYCFDAFVTKASIFDPQGVLIEEGVL